MHGPTYIKKEEEENSLKFTGRRSDIYDTRPYTRTNCVSYDSDTSANEDNSLRNHIR